MFNGRIKASTQSTDQATRNGQAIPVHGNPFKVHISASSFAAECSSYANWLTSHHAGRGGAERLPAKQPRRRLPIIVSFSRRSRAAGHNRSAASKESRLWFISGPNAASSAAEENSRWGNSSFRKSKSFSTERLWLKGEPEDLFQSENYRPLFGSLQFLSRKPPINCHFFAKDSWFPFHSRTINEYKRVRRTVAPLTSAEPHVMRYVDDEDYCRSGPQIPKIKRRAEINQFLIVRNKSPPFNGLMRRAGDDFPQLLSMP